MISPSSSAGPNAFNFKPCRQPMLWAAIAYSLGIIFGTYEWRPSLWLVLAAAVFAAAAAYFSNQRVVSRKAARREELAAAWTLGLATFFLAGALHVELRNGASRLETSILPYADHEPVTVTAHVTHDSRLHQEDFGEARQTLDVETEEVETPSGEVVPVHSGVRLNIYQSRPRESGMRETMETGLVPAFRYGQRLRFLAKLKPPRNFRNPGAFDYEEYLADRGIAALGSARLDNVELLPGFAGSRMESWRSRMHNSVLAKVHQLWPARQAALIDAMIIGDEAFIDRDTRVDFQRSGTYHVLVVSGMNISILAFVVFWTLRRLRLSDLPATLLTISVCAGYAFITEVGAPVWRATLMCAVYLGTRLLYRDRAMLNALGVAALGLLMFDPRQLFAASFQMTFVCVLIVAGIGIPFRERTTQLYKLALINWESGDFATQLPPRVAQFRLDLQLIAARLGLFLGEAWSARLVRGSVRLLLTSAELIFISAIMQMGLALPMAYYFHRATTIGLPANLIVVPAIELLMPAAVSALALGYISPWLAKLPALVTTFALSGISGTVRGLGGLRLADLRVAMPSDALIGISVAALVLAMWSARKKLAFAAAGLSAILTTSLALAFWPPVSRFHSGVLEVTSIDVGEGDSSLLVTPQGRTLLIDAGGPIGPGSSQLDFGEDVVSPYLWSRGISCLDAVALTHGHSDHIGGMIAVLKNFRPKELWVGLLPPSRALDDVVSTARSLGTTVVRHWEGDEYDFGGAHVSVLFPPSDSPVGNEPRNNDSLVLRLAYGDSSALMEAMPKSKSSVASQLCTIPPPAC